MSRLHWGAGLTILFMFVPLQATLVLTGYFIGQRWLRMAMLRQKTRWSTRAGLPPPLPGGPGRGLTPLDDNADPLLWKELCSGGRVSLRRGLRDFTRSPGDPTIDDRMNEMGPIRWLFASRESVAFLLRVFFVLVVLLLFALTIIGEISSNWVGRVLGGMTLAWLICSTGLTAATGISRERQKQTLVDLLMLPGPRRDLLRAKALGALARGLWPGLVLAGLIATAVIGFGASLLSAALLALTAAALTLFSVAAGIWLSARCRTALNATANWIGLMAGVVIGTFLLAEANLELVTRPDEPPRLDYPGWTRVVNPLLSWGRLTFRYDYRDGRYEWGEGQDAWPLTFADVGPAFLCPILYASIGGLLWILAVRRFEKEGRT
jgi:hypothetical protein